MVAYLASCEFSMGWMIEVNETRNIMCKSPPSINVTLPVWNEVNCLAASVEAVIEELERWEDPWELTIVDNGSTDGTHRIAEKLAKTNDQVRLLTMPFPGRGGALKNAWLASQADIVSYMDVDLSTDLSDFSSLLKPLKTGLKDIVVGSRLLAESKIVRRFHREWISRTYASLVRGSLKLPLSDYQCGFKAMTKETAVELIPLIKDDGWFFDTELLAIGHHLGFRIEEVPVRWREDRDSRVKILQTAWADLMGLARTKYRLMRDDFENAKKLV